MLVRRSLSRGTIIVQLFVLVVFCLSGLTFGQSTTPATPTTAPATQKAATGPVKVGVLLSHFTATGPSWIGHPYGLDWSILTIEQLKDPHLELIPIIEPETADALEIADALTRHFPEATPITITDKDAMKKLDVVALIACSNMKPESLDALEDTVKSGVGLLASGIGVVTPGPTEQVSRLQGLEKCAYGWKSTAVECTVKQAHPLLGDLKVGDTFTVNPNGMFGYLKQGTALLEITDPQKTISKNIKKGMVFAPLYISTLGKGQIVSINWAVFMPPAPEIKAATHDKFFVRCCQWLAHRPVDAGADTSDASK